MIDIFDFLKNKKATDEINQNDEFDKQFGAPKTETFATKDLIAYLDKIANCIEIAEAENPEEQKDFAISKAIATDTFKNAVKILYKKQRADIIKELKAVVMTLAYEKTGGKSIEISIDGEKAALQYSYITDSIIILGFKADTIQQISNI